MVTGLGKPIGVVVAGTQLVADDQMSNQVLKAPLSSPATTTVITSAIQNPDAVTSAPDGTVFVGTADGAVFKIATDGTVSQVVSGLGKLRGVAYDADHKRLFIALPGSQVPDAGPPTSTIQIEPVN